MWHVSCLIYAFEGEHGTACIQVDDSEKRMMLRYCSGRLRSAQKILFMSLSALAVIFTMAMSAV